MSLFAATLLPALVLLAAGAVLAWNPPGVRERVRGFPRSRWAAYITMGGATAWFLYHITQLGEADFGAQKNLIFGIFLVLGILSFRYAPDFLSVRGAAALALLIAHELLSAAYMKEPTSRLFLVSLTYAAICLALYLGALPYKLRDFFKWLYARPWRVRALGAALAGYGLVLVLAAFTYGQGA